VLMPGRRFARRLYSTSFAWRCGATTRTLFADWLTSYRRQRAEMRTSFNG
jgi:hypothetical protein